MQTYEEFTTVMCDSVLTDEESKNAIFMSVYDGVMEFDIDNKRYELVLEHRVRGKEEIIFLYDFDKNEFKVYAVEFRHGNFVKTQTPIKFLNEIIRKKII